MKTVESSPGQSVSRPKGNPSGVWTSPLTRLSGRPCSFSQGRVSQPEPFVEATTGRDGTSSSATSQKALTECVSRGVTLKA